ncbi:MAG TPA: MBL fold metallo-hydrolase [Polyangiales bacterium]
MNIERIARLAALVALVLLVGCATSRSVTPLTDGITVHTFRRDHVNAHLVARGQSFFLVDAGLEQNAAALAEDLRRAGFDPAQLRAIILTHGHADHAGGASFFRARFGTPVIIGAPDATRLSAGTNDHLCPTNRAARGRLEADQAAHFTPFSADRSVASAQALEPLVGVPGSIIPLPGHTPGSLIVVLPRAALVGDLFRGAVLGSSAEVHFYMCDLEGNQRDVRTLLDQLAPAATTFFVGHFGPVSRDKVQARFR